MQMQAAILTEAHTPFKIETVDVEAPKAGEVLVKMAASGVCHSDWHIVAGKAAFPSPMILGHEGAGVVETVGEGVTRMRPGDHVTLSWKACCGECFYCQNDAPSICDTHAAEVNAGVQTDGTSRISWNGEPVYILGGLGVFAEYVIARDVSCVPVRKDVPLEVAGFGRLCRVYRRGRGDVHRAGAARAERRRLRRRRRRLEHHPGRGIMRR